MVVSRNKKWGEVGGRLQYRGAFGREGAGLIHNLVDFT